MTEAAAIAGSFADFRPVKTRGVMQLMIEIPIEQADAALAALGGVPQPGKERWVGIARLADASARQARIHEPGRGSALPPAEPTDDERPPPSPRSEHMSAAQSPSRRSWRELKPSQRAGILCNDAQFSAWLGVRGRPDDLPGDTARHLRERLNIISRAQLDDDATACAAFEQIEASFMAAVGRAANPERIV